MKVFAVASFGKAIESRLSNRSEFDAKLAVPVSTPVNEPVKLPVATTPVVSDLKPTPAEINGVIIPTEDVNFVTVVLFVIFAVFAVKTFVDLL